MFLYFTKNKLLLYISQIEKLSIIENKKKAKNGVRKIVEKQNIFVLFNKMFDDINEGVKLNL